MTLQPEGDRGVETPCGRMRTNLSGVVLAVACLVVAASAVTPAPAQTPAATQTPTTGVRLESILARPEGRLLSVTLKADGPIQRYVLSRQGPPEKRDLAIRLSG